VGWSTLLSERLTDQVEVTLIDQNDAFTLGFSKLDIVFRHQTRDEVRLPYRRLAQRDVVFRQETILSIDPQQRRVTTTEATYNADFLVVALGADYDLAATPGFVEGGFEYYSVDGAERLRDELPSFRGGKVLLAVLSIPFKCPPAPYEGILLLHDYLVERAIRDATQLHVVSPQPAPIPVSAEALERTMAARGIEFTKRRRVYGIDPASKVGTSRTTTSRRTCSSASRCTRCPTYSWRAGSPRTGGSRSTRSPSLLRSLASTRSVTVPRPGPQGRCLRRIGRRAVADQIAASIWGSRARPYDGSGLCFVEWATANWAELTCTSTLREDPKLHCWDRARSTSLRRPSSERSVGPGGSTSNKIEVTRCAAAAQRVATLDHRAAEALFGLREAGQPIAHLRPGR
jgi:sulfide:quinone oxidoreductase